MGRWLLALCLLMMAIAPAAAQDGAAQTLYTVQLDDTLENVTRQLKEEHGLYLQADHTLLTTRVVVNLEDATFLQLLEAICRQVGAVYDPPVYIMPGQTAVWRLREGDWDLDCRPRTEVEGFLVAVEQVNLQYGYSRRFAWGNDESQTSDSASLNITLRVVPPSLELLGRIAGVGLLKAIFDTGETAEPPSQPQGMVIHRRMMARSGMTNISLPDPPENATRITELHGELEVYRQDPRGEAEFTPADVGSAKPFGGQQLTLTKWEKTDQGVSVTLSRPATPQLGTAGQFTAVLHGEGDQAAHPRNTSVTSTGAVITWVFTYLDVGFEPVKVRAEGDVLGGPADTHEFVIEDIELP